MPSIQRNSHLTLAIEQKLENGENTSLEPVAHSGLDAAEKRWRIWDFNICWWVRQEQSSKDCLVVNLLTFLIVEFDPAAFDFWTNSTPVLRLAPSCSPAISFHQGSGIDCGCSNPSTRFDSFPWSNTQSLRHPKLSWAEDTFYAVDTCPLHPKLSLEPFRPLCSGPCTTGIVVLHGILVKSSTARGLGRVHGTFLCDRRLEHGPCRGNIKLITELVLFTYSLGQGVKS